MSKLSDVDIANLALDQVGQTNISSFSDGTLASTACARNYNQTIRAVLNSGRWKSARVKVQLSQRSDLTDPSAPLPNGVTNLGTPVGGWPPGNNAYVIYDSGLDSAYNGLDGGNPLMPYAFQLPGDYIRLVRFNDVDSAETSYPFWEVRADILWTNQTTAYLDYVRDVTMPGIAGSNPPTVGNLDPILVEVIAKGLAARLAWVFQQRQGLQDQLKKEYDGLLSRALAIDARSEKVALRNPYMDSNWIRSRYFSTNA